jgi:hypothetical protein
MNKIVKSVLFFTILCASAYVLWECFGKSIYLNNSSSTIHITSLEHSKWVNLAKWEDQSAGLTYGMELLINGQTDRTLQLLFGPEKNGMMQQVLLKKGTIDFEYMRDWYSDSCYLFFPSEAGSNVDFEITYRFFGDIENN